MLSYFMLGVTVLLICAFIFLFWPFWQSMPKRCYQKRVRILQKALHSGLLTTTEYETKRIICQSLTNNHSIRTSQMVLLLFCLLSLPLAVMSGYLLVGQPTVFAVQSPNAENDIDHTVATFQSIQKRIQENPQDAEAWWLLARQYRQQEQFEQALQAFAKAHQLLVNHVDIMIEYAETIAYSNTNHIFNKQARDLLKAALEIEPEHQRGLLLLGISEEQQENYSLALQAWTKLLKLLPADEPQVRAALQNQIDRVQAQISSVQLEAMPLNTSGLVSGVTVTIDIEASLKSQVKEGEVLYVFAKTTDSPIPLASKRITVKTWPVVVTLSDLDSMMPTKKLSQAEKIIVGARISKSGEALPQSGDLQGYSAEYDLHSLPTIWLTIDNKID